MLNSAIATLPSFFEDLDETTLPVAAASLGQVYKLRLRSTGREVAVKVQRPDMIRAVSLDLFLLRKYMSSVEAFKHFLMHKVGLMAPRKQFDLELLNAFASASYLELDYHHEATNAGRFAQELLPLLPAGRCFIPAVIQEVSARRIITSEWVEGRRLADCDRATINRLVPVGVQCFIAQLLQTGFFHADPHPGNLLVNEKGQLVLIDFGLCAEIRSFDADAMTAAILHLMQGDVPRLLEDAIQLGFLPPDVDTGTLLPALQGVFAKAAILRRRATELIKQRSDLETSAGSIAVATSAAINGARAIDPDTAVSGGAENDAARRSLCPWHRFRDSLLGSAPAEKDTRTADGVVVSLASGEVRNAQYRPAERRRHFKEISHELNQIFFDFPFTVPPYFALITRALILLEGIAVAGDPKFDIFKAAEPFARQRALEVFGAVNLVKLAGTALSVDEESWRRSVSSGLESK